MSLGNATTQIQNQFILQDPRVMKMFVPDKFTADKHFFRCNVSDWAYLITNPECGVLKPTPRVCPTCSSVYPILAILHSLLEKCNIVFETFPADTQQFIRKVLGDLEGTLPLSTVFDKLLHLFVSFSNHLFRKGK